MVSEIQTSSLIASTRVADPKNVTAPTVACSKAARVEFYAADKASMSVLSRQLGESAVRAEARDKSLSREALGELAARLRDTLEGDSYANNKTRHALEVPNTLDPLLLARARQATQYEAQQSPNVPNPFAALSREQASLIAYDEKGPYTVNERRAALSRTQDMEQHWRAGSLNRATQESINNGGRTPKFYAECFEHYKSLPAIERAQYDEGYEEQLRADINRASGEAGSNDRQYNLFEILAGLQNPQKKPGKPAVKDESASTRTPGNAPLAKAQTSVTTQPASVIKTNVSPDPSPGPAADERREPPVVR